jgi:hypothetical protein
MPTNLTPLNISQLINGNSHYSIPIYQRNYAWGEKEITQLIQDIADYAEINSNKDYYIGTLVVYERKDEIKDLIYETIDGQQRLTTLTILLSTLKNNKAKLNFTNDISWFKLNLAFDSRVKSTETLQNIYDGNVSRYNFNTEIKSAYEDCLKILERVIKDKKNFTIQQFCDYLFQKVLILRVPVPADTNLNHYFEIMNSRGEQLEKHEVLKAKLLEILSTNEVETKAFNQVWEACSNMEKYVQYGFSVSERNLIFGNNDWNKIEATSFDDLSSKLTNNQASENQKLSAFDILKGQKFFQNKNEQDNENPDRFNSVINFPNFLLHVLRVQQKKDIPLDDKRLLDTFDEVLKNETNKEIFVKTFAFNLLKCKFLFDNYVIKREFLNGTDNWSLKRLKWYSGNKVSYINSFGVEENNDDANNKTILMLLAMFHVSTPTLVYKHWLNAALKYVYENFGQIESDKYTTYLKTLAKSFLFDRFLASSPKEYFEIIYTNSGTTKNTENDIDLTKLDQGTSVENFVFNYLDFLLWQEQNDDNFKFTFRSSVEHYYPQNPLEGLEPLGQTNVDKFGNLCLISNNTNSRLWNLPPDGKKSYFLNTNTYESLKQKIMLREPKWTLTEIEKHGKEMTDKLIGK